jgi:hypothetical protein
MIEQKTVEGILDQTTEHQTRVDRVRGLVDLHGENPKKLSRLLRDPLERQLYRENTTDFYELREGEDFGDYINRVRSYRKDFRTKAEQREARLDRIRREQRRDFIRGRQNRLHAGATFKALRTLDH